MSFMTPDWILARLSLLTQMFAIDIAAFALMSNHYHLVVRVDATKAAAWTAQDIADRWQHQPKNAHFWCK
jgi:hypothetical protein